MIFSCHFTSQDELDLSCLWPAFFFFFVFFILYDFFFPNQCIESFQWAALSESDPESKDTTRWCWYDSEQRQKVKKCLRSLLLIKRLLDSSAVLLTSLPFESQRVGSNCRGFFFPSWIFSLGVSLLVVPWSCIVLDQDNVQLLNYPIMGLFNDLVIHFCPTELLTTSSSS